MPEQAKKLYTVDDWLALPDEQRCELIEGEIVRRAAPSAEHGFAQGDIARALAGFHQGGSGGGGPGGWWIGTEISVIYEGRPNGFTHDVVGWRRDRHPVRPSGKRVTAKPDWVCEIISGNRSNDLSVKRWVLHEHRVEYYWLVDLEAKNLSVLKWSEKGYVIIADKTAGDVARLEPFEAVELNASMLLGLDES